MIFFLKISVVYCLASHLFVRTHPKKDRLNQRKRTKMINQLSKFYCSELLRSCRITTSVSKSANLKRGLALNDNFDCAFLRFPRPDIEKEKMTPYEPNLCHCYM